MRKKNIPYAHAKSVYDIPADFYLSHGVKTLLLDLDNTLDPYTVSEPSALALSWARSMRAAGLDIFILSNNSGKRVGKYASLLEVKSRFFMRKPFSGPLKRFLKKEGLDKDEVMLIGDQIQTDVKAGNGAGIRVILTEPLYKVEPPWTKINRIFDRPKRKKILSKHLCPEWEEV